MSRTLVIGYGNRDRQDDGVAYYVVNALRSALGQERLSQDDSGLEGLGSTVDSIFCLQLAPELLETALDYERLVFVDAHVHPDANDVHCEEVQPEYAVAAFTHHMTPAMFLALLQALYDSHSDGHIISVRGYRFDFDTQLSPQTEALIEPARDKILELLDQGT